MASGVERHRMGLLLSLPGTRTPLLLERFVSPLAPIAPVNAAVPASVLAVCETVDLAALVAGRALSVLHLLAFGGIGLVLSVLVDRADVANRLALGLVFGLLLV